LVESIKVLVVFCGCFLEQDIGVTGIWGRDVCFLTAICPSISHKFVQHNEYKYLLQNESTWDIITKESEVTLKPGGMGACRAFYCLRLYFSGIPEKPVF